MNFLRKLIIIDKKSSLREINNTSSNASAKFRSLLELIQEKSFNTIFEKTLLNFCNGKYETINEENSSIFIKSLKQEIENSNLVFQIKNDDEFDYILVDGEIVEVIVKRHDILKDMFLNAMNLPDYCNVHVHIEDLLYMVKRNAQLDIKEKSIRN